MNAERRDVVLEELGLTPLWVRRELLQAQSAAEAQATPVPAASIEAPSVVTPVESIVAPKPRATVPAAPIPSPSVPVADTTATPDRDARAAEIAQMNWSELEAAVATCTACALCKSRQKTVFGVGNASAPWVIVGEAPGAEEDRQGEPFVGPAGKLLDNMLASVGRSRRENVYILNTLKCRPPQNRNPEPAELAMCAPFLHRQIELIAPKVILATGRFAVQTLLGREATISSVRGRVHTYRAIPVIVTYHPAYLLRNLPDKYKAWQDLVLARRTLQATESANTATPA
ncbi:MAG: uracil-DNA glycosylase [Burkholderiales bacterium]|nr:uracil-DNA glycosylase [Burkholderiales bacterium]